VPAANDSTPGLERRFRAPGRDIREWTQLVGVQGLPRSKSGQALMLLEGMQRSRATRCGVPPAR
jgi:hypothetical protein